MNELATKEKSSNKEVGGTYLPDSHGASNIEGSRKQNSLQNSNPLLNPFVVNDPEILTSCLLEHTRGLKIWKTGDLCSHKLFNYIVEELLKSREDSVTLNYSELMKKFGVKTRKTIDKAVHFLEDAKVIQRSKKFEYWVNPYFINLKSNWKEDYRSFLKEFHPEVYLKL
jgi:hypothetical protein